MTLEGVEPIPRCAVPTRDPDTGAAYDGVRETFIRRRGATLPPWTDGSTLAGNHYSVTVGTHIPEGERDGELAVGAPVELLPDARGGRVDRGIRRRCAGSREAADRARSSDH